MMESSDFKYISNLVEDESGIIISTDKAYLIESRLAPLIRRENMGSLHALVVQLQLKLGDNLRAKVIDAMATNETFFFRDQAPFDVLASYVIPELIKARKSVKKLNIWCAACSSGQEPYSIAMIIREQFPVLRDWAINILATDIDGKILSKAESGYYSSFDIKRGLPSKMMKYFVKSGRGWTVKDEISQMITFKQDNLIRPSLSYPIMDIVFMRNVLIYFEPKVKYKILSNVENILKSDGYLFLGKSERISIPGSAFESSSIDSTPCFRLKSSIRVAS